MILLSGPLSDVLKRKISKQPPSLLDFGFNLSDLEYDSDQRYAGHCLILRIKGQLISKANCPAVILPKNKRMNLFLLVCDVFSFVFLENPRPEKTFRDLLTFRKIVKLSLAFPVL